MFSQVEFPPIQCYNKKRKRFIHGKKEKKWYERGQESFGLLNFERDGDGD